MPPAPAAVHPRPATLAAAALAATALAAVRATANLTALATTSGASGLYLGGVRVHHVCQPRDAVRPVSVPAYAARA